MIKSLWYLAKIFILLGVGVYLAVLPGNVQINWNEYTVTVQLGIVALILFVAVLTIAFVTGVVHDLFLLPKEWQRSRFERRRTKGHQAIVRALSAAAAGDYKNAYYLAHRAQKFLPDSEAGLSLLLQAHSAKGRGKEEDSESAFKALLKNADTAILGVQGLIHKAMLEGDYSRALLLARESAAAQPKNPHLLKPVYDLEIRNRLWPQALLTLDKIASHKIMPAEEIKSDRAAIYIVLGDTARAEGKFQEATKDYKRAFQADPKSTPAAMHLANVDIDMGQRVAALAVVKKNWTLTAHPQLLDLWVKLCPTDKKDQRTTEYRWMEWVAEFHPNSQEALLAVAQAAINHGMWGEAKSALMRAEKIRPSRDLYLMWVRLEELTNKNPDVIRQWLDRASKSNAGPKWICSKTHRASENWIAIVEPEGFFNTMEWRDAPALETSEPQWLLKQA